MRAVHCLPKVWRRQVARAAALVVLALLPAGVRAASNDDRASLQRFVTSGAISNRRLQQDLARATWPPQELRAALARAYGVKTVALSAFLSSPAGVALLQGALPWWSVDLAPALRMAALRSAILADSRDGSIALVSVLERLPLRFSLPQGVGLTAVTAAPIPPAEASCGCSEECGGSSVAHLAFLVACLQAGANGQGR